MKEQRFSFRHYKLIFLFFIFAALTYLLYWYLVPNLNYEIPVYYFIALLLAAMGWYVYDSHYKADSISYIDTYADGLAAKNSGNRETFYYYRDIHHCTLTDAVINGYKFYRLDLNMKTGASVHLRLDNFSGKDIQLLAALITTKTGSQQGASKTTPEPRADKGTVVPGLPGNGTRIYISPFRQYLLAGALFFMGCMLLWMSINMIIDLFGGHPDLFILILSVCLLLLGLGLLFLCILIFRQKIIQLEIGTNGLLFKDMVWGRSGWSRGSNNNPIIDIYFKKKYRFIAYSDIKSVELVPSKLFGDSILLHTTWQECYLPLLLENRQQFTRILQLIEEKLHYRN